MSTPLERQPAYRCTRCYLIQSGPRHPDNKLCDACPNNVEPYPFAEFIGDWCIELANGGIRRSMCVPGAKTGLNIEVDGDGDAIVEIVGDDDTFRKWIPMEVLVEFAGVNDRARKIANDMRSRAQHVIDSHGKSGCVGRIEVELAEAMLEIAGERT